METDEPVRNYKIISGLLCAGTLAAFLTFAYPIYVIRPFRAQGFAELAVALLLKRWAFLLASSAAAIVVLCSMMLWGNTKRGTTRIVYAAASVLAVLFAALTQVNVYERMFHRIDSPASIPASEAKLERHDMVLAIHVEGQARAYPIRMMGYHHIVNDRVGSVAIVATY